MFNAGFWIYPSIDGTISAGMDGGAGFSSINSRNPQRGYFQICGYADLPALQPSPPKNTVNNWCVLDFFGTMAASMACIAIGPIPYSPKPILLMLSHHSLHDMFSRESLVTVAGWGVDRTYSDGLKLCSKANLKVMTAFCRCEGTRVQMQ